MCLRAASSFNLGFNLLKDIHFWKTLYSKHHDSRCSLLSLRFCGFSLLNWILISVLSIVDLQSLNSFCHLKIYKLSMLLGFNLSSCLSRLFCLTKCLINIYIISLAAKLSYLLLFSSLSTRLKIFFGWRLERKVRENKVFYSLSLCSVGRNVRIEKVTFNKQLCTTFSPLLNLKYKTKENLLCLPNCFSLFSL